MIMISVIMLTYNREDMVRRAIESIRNQTFADFEYIIVDNGSSDCSGAIADEYATQDSRIKVIHRKRGNIGSGRNAGLDAAKGQYITFIDDDDWCEPDYLSFLYALAANTHADVSICGAADKIFDEKRIMSTEEALIELLWRKKYNVSFPAKLFRASLFRGNRFSELSKYDDIELMPCILGRAERIAYHGLPKYTFVRHRSNNSAWTTNHSLLDRATLAEYLSIYNTRTDWLISKFHKNAEMWNYFNWSFMISMVEKIYRLNIHDCEHELAYMTDSLRKNHEMFMQCELALEFEKEWMKMYIVKP
jgi:glycosyltransferase involved in cell wall biosynthesis